MNKPSLQEWFCLQDGRKNFQIDPAQDQQYMFGEQVWESDIDNRLKKCQLLGIPLRLVWWGQYGIGKTHRLHHTKYLVEKHDYRFLPIYVKATDIQDKTGFERLHFEMLEALGRERMRKMVSSYLLKIRTAVPGTPSLQEVCGTSSDIEAALRSFGGDNEKLVLPAWRFLSGLKLKGNDLIFANVTRDSLSSSLDFAGVISALARIVQLEMEKEILFLVDEVENLTKVQNKVAKGRWQESIRAMLDINTVGVVFAIGAERQEGLPRLVIEPDIVRRFQRDNYVHMEAYKPPVTKNFVRGMLGAWISPERRGELEKSEKFSESAPGYDPELYPFNSKGFEKFCDWAAVDPRSAKPSEIIARLNNIAGEAYLRNRRLITPKLLKELGIA